MYGIASIDAKSHEASVSCNINMAHHGGGTRNRKDTQNALHNIALNEVHRKIESKTRKDGSHNHPDARGPLSHHQRSVRY